MAWCKGRLFPVATMRNKAGGHAHQKSDLLRRVVLSDCQHDHEVSHAVEICVRLLCELLNEAGKICPVQRPGGV